MSFNNNQENYTYSPETLSTPQNKNIPTDNNKIFMGEKLTSFSFKFESYMGSVTYKGFEPKNVKFIDTKFDELK